MSFDWRVNLEKGAWLAELSDKASGRKLVDTGNRRGGAAGLPGWVDHLLPAGCDVRAFAGGKVREAVKWERLPWRERTERSSRRVRAIFSSRSPELELEKSVTFSRTGRTLQFTQGLHNRMTRPVSFRYGTEFNWNLKDAHVNRLGETPSLKRFSVVDPAARLQISWLFSRPARLMYFPRETKGALEKRVYQGVSVTQLWNVSLAPRGRWSVRWTLTVGEPDARA